MKDEVDGWRGGHDRGRNVAGGARTNENKDKKEEEIRFRVFMRME